MGSAAFWQIDRESSVFLEKKKKLLWYAIEAFVVCCYIIWPRGLDEAIDVWATLLPR